MTIVFGQAEFSLDPLRGLLVSQVVCNCQIGYMSGVHYLGSGWHFTEKLICCSCDIGVIRTDGKPFLDS